MADTAVSITAGTGTNIDTRTESTNGNHRQVIVIGDPATNAGVAPVDATAGLKVDLGADNDITGTVTANAGTNLNTSALALETGGNLDSIKTNTDKIPAQGQALAAASLPVVLTAAQVTTLTPPAAITGYATETTLASIKDTAGIKKITDALPTGTNLIGKVSIDQVTANANEVVTKTGSVTNATLQAGSAVIGKLAANSGVDIGDVDVTSIAAGTNYIGKVRPTDGTTDAEIIPLAGYNAQAVGIVDGSGNQITSFGGGVQYTEGDTDVSITGTALMFETNTGTSALGVVNATNKLPVDVGTVPVTGTFYQATQPVSFTGSTDAATSAKQDTGNTSLGSIDTKTPALGQALAAASVPVILPSATITTLTPPAAITNFANETGGNLAAATTALQLIDNAVSGTGFNISQIGGAAAPIGAGLEATAVRVTLPTDGTGKVGLNAGVNNIGDVDVLTVPTDPFGANADAASATGSISAKLRAISTALGITALDLGSGTGGTRTLRTFQDTAQFVGGTGVDSSAVQRVSLATNVALPAGTNGIGKLTANSGVTIGAVEIAAAQTLATVSTLTNQTQEGGVNISLNAGAVDTGTRRVVQANGAGKTILSAGGSASSSGNNTLVAAGTNKLKVFAFTLSTTSTTAMTCIFQSGASGTELWRCILQAGTGVSTGANLTVSPPAWLFATASATLLNLNLSSANAVHWSVSYFDEA
jgi:hypothetical protein